MDEDDDPPAIAALEGAIEALVLAGERSRKLAKIADAAALFGAGWLVAMTLGLVPAGAAALVFSTSAVLGGVVLAGSSRSSLAETQDRLAKAQAERSRLIDAIAPRAINGQEPP